MSRMIGTVSRGIRAPIIRQGDDLVEIVSSSILEAAEAEGFEIRDRDIVAMTEAIVARAQGNYASTDDIAKDVRAKFGGETVGVIFPILSRNRFSVCLKGIAKGVKKVVLMLSYPSDEVGNHLVSLDALDEKGIDPYRDVLDITKYRELFGYAKHRFTGVDYIEFYEGLVRECGADFEVVFANDPRAILPYTKNVLNCDIHTRERTKRILKRAGAEIVYGLDGTPNELKLKYLADNDFADLSGEALKAAIKTKIQQKDGDLVGNMISEGTTPRRLTDLIGSLCDLTSGSGDKGTPIVFIQGYFDNCTTE